MAWARVRDAEADIEKEEEMVKVSDRRILQAEERVREMAETEKEKIKEKKTLEGEIKDLAKDFAGWEAEVKRLEEDSSRRQEKARAANKEVLSL